MNGQNKNASFGQKGVNDTTKSLAQSLLTGKPLSRARVQDRIPKLKPRSKPRFGRKEGQSSDDILGPETQPRQTSRGWTFWMTLVAALVVGLTGPKFM